MSDRNYTEATKSALFALSTKCYFPRCMQPSVTFFGEEPEKKVEIAHIHAVKPGGPRYKQGVDTDAFHNLLLLCSHHHKKVDKMADVHIYTADLLREWKTAAEKDVRSKFDGLDRLTEGRLEKMLQQAAQVTTTEVADAISDLQDVSEGAAAILRALLERIEGHYLDLDAVATLDAASYRLRGLEEYASSLLTASRKLENLEGSAAQLRSSASIFAEVDLRGLHSWLDEFRSAYRAAIRQEPDFTGAATNAARAVEQAGKHAVSEIQRTAASVEHAGPVFKVDDAQRWKFFSAGVIIAFLLVTAGIILHTQGVM